MDRPDATDLRTRGAERIAVIAGTMLVIFIVLAAAICVGVFVILSPMIMGVELIPT